jgi:hypothetical protein
MRNSSQYKNIPREKEKPAKSQKWRLETWWVLLIFPQTKRSKENIKTYQTNFTERSKQPQVSQKEQPWRLDN